MSRQATIALITLMGRGHPLKEAVAHLRSQGKAAYEDEALPNGRLKPELIDEEAPEAPEAPEGGDEGQEGGQGAGDDQTGADGSENSGEGDGGSDPTANDEKTEDQGKEDAETGTDEAETGTDEAAIEIPANWAELEWPDRLALAKNVAGALDIADPSNIKSGDDVNAVMTAAIATLSA